MATTTEARELGTLTRDGILAIDGTTDREFWKLIQSRSKASFGATITEHADGSVSILTTWGPGYKSAHRDFARSVGLRKKETGYITWINLHGVRVAASHWSAAA